MFGAAERLPAFGARTFFTVITTSVVQDLNEKKSGALIIHCVAHIVAEPCSMVPFLTLGHLSVLSTHTLKIAVPILLCHLKIPFRKVHSQERFIKMSSTHYVDATLLQ
jgi:hypothetical protein